MAFNTAGVGGETATAQSGCQIDEVLSTGQVRQVWQFEK
jgi:hypothetical protein